MEEKIFRLKEVGKEDAAKTETVDYLSLPEYAPFSYNEYVKNPSRKVITRTGIEVHKIEYLPGTDFPCRITLLLPNGSVQCYTVTKDGHEYKSDLDIFFDDTVRIPRYKATSHSETITESSDISDESTDYLKIKREDFEELRSQKDSLMAKVAEIGLELQDCEKANKELRKKISRDTRCIESTDYLKIKKDDFEELRNQAESLQSHPPTEDDSVSKGALTVSGDVSETYLASLLAKRGYKGELVKETDIRTDKNIVGTKKEIIKIGN